MSSATFRVYAELNDFLPRARRQTAFTCDFTGQPAVKDLIEALGVPHPEVDLILANGVSVDFAYAVQPGDTISVYPVFEALAIAPRVRLRPRPLRHPRFVLDAHLGKLAGYLRLLGFDTLYRNDYGDPELARLSAAEARILLSRDRGLLKRSQVTHAYCVRATDPDRQIREVVAYFDLAGAAQPFTRCLRCNGALAAVPAEAVAGQVPPAVQARQSDFRRCAGCGQIYWRGSHYDRLSRLVDEVLHAAGPA